MLGPFNTTYRLLRSHLRLAALDSLIANNSPLHSDCSSNSGGSGSGGGSNQWNQYHDMNLVSNATTRSLSIPGGDADHSVCSTGGHGHGSPTADTMSPGKYCGVAVPYQPEHQSQEVCSVCVYGSD